MTTPESAKSDLPPRSESDAEAIFFAALAKDSAEEQARHVEQACGGDPALRAGRAAAERSTCVWASSIRRRWRRHRRLPSRPAPSSAATSCSSRSARAGSARSSWPSRPRRSSARSRSRSSRPGMDTRQVIARFEAERQALALMDHPNIAKVFDAGVDRRRPAVLRDGAGQGRADHEVLRRAPPDAARAAGTVRAGLPGGAARASEGDHPPRPQAVERPGRACTTASRCRR